MTILTEKNKQEAKQSLG